MRLPGLPLLLVAVAAGAPAADVASLERAALRAQATRDHLLRERVALGKDAVALADEVARQKTGSPGSPRAPRALEESLRAFERHARRLDGLDRQVETATADLRRALRSFEEGADRAVEELARGRLPPDELARGLAEVQAARERLQGLLVPPPLRPPLDVPVDETDGPDEIETKIGLLLAERERLLGESRRNEEESRLLAARLELKIQLQRQLETARRDAGPEMGLLSRQADDLRRALAGLQGDLQARDREKLELARMLAGLDGRLAEAEERRRQLRPHPQTPGAP